MIRLSQAGVRNGSFSLANLSFEIATGACAILAGESGAGKTTLLEAVCGLREINEGALHLDGREATRLAPRDRDLGYVPQDTVLSQSKTVRGHLEFGPELKRWSKHRIAERTKELSELLGLDLLLERHPGQLSGGERQRVALARAIAAEPKHLCLDEPLSALDPENREIVVSFLGRQKTELGTTILLVTHRIDEVDGLGDKVYLLEDGSLEMASRR